MNHKALNTVRPEPVTPPCNKKIYNTEEEAQDMIRFIKEHRRTRELYVYKCPVCGLWHLTSKKK